MVLDSQGSLVGLDLLVRRWGRIFLDRWETPASLDWMESMVSRVLQVLPGRLVQAQPRETEVTPGSRDSPAPLAGKETRRALEAPDSPAAPVSKESEVRLATAEVPDSRVSLVNLVTMDSKDPRDCKDVPVVRVYQESRCHRATSSPDPSEKWASLVTAEPPVSPENPVSLDCLDVQVRRVVPVLWVNLAGLDLLVYLGPPVTPDPRVSLDPLENKVFLARSVVPAFPAASAAATASASLW